MLATALAVHPASIQQPKQVKLAQPFLRRVQGRKQSTSQLGRRHDLVVVQPLQDEMVPVGELPQNLHGIARPHRAHPRTR
jgi:hypothetical protein